MLFKREICAKIKRVAAEFPAIVVTGARQAGKTTLLKGMFPDHNYVSLDVPSTADLAENNPDIFLQRYPPPVIIDEVQYAPKIFRNLKVWIDQHREVKGQILLTGSQKFTLMKEVSESLAGRVAVLELEPLSLFEILQSVPIDQLGLQAALVRGFFPELWKERHRSIAPFYSSYLSTYVERDIKQILNVGSTLDFEKFMRICAGRVGQLLVKSEIAKDVGVTVKTVSSWFSVLEASNQIVLVQPYFENFGKRLVKSPKLYFADTGFLIYLLGLDEESIIDSPFIGALWENLVFIEMKKRILASLSGGQIYFYRDNMAREVDFLFVNQGKVNFIECKWSMSPDSAQAAKIEAVARDLNSRSVRRGNSFIIARNRDPFKLGQDTLVTSIFDLKLPGLSPATGDGKLDI
jgi:predicted AAA+ superfamily ATPase